MLKLPSKANHINCNNMFKNFKKYYELPTDPEQVYLALTNENTIYLWSGAEATMSTEPGSEFSLWNGDIVGKNLEFELNKKIVQQWYFDGVTDESIVTLKLHQGKKPGTTSVELNHVNIPADEYDSFVDGWNDAYFGSLQEFFEEEL